MDSAAMEALWAEHQEAEFTTKDVEATLQTMTDGASVDHVPVGTGGRGHDELRAFYGNVFIPSWPPDVEIQPKNRVLGTDQLVDEVRVSLTHTKPMDWLLPGVAPTNRKIELDLVVVIGFRDDKIASERIYWDHAAVLQQVGLLDGSR